MKAHLVHSILLFSLLFSQLYNSVITAVYELNYQYYSTVLCENADKPELHCEGKCYFAKQLQLHEDSEPSSPPRLLPELLLFSQDSPSELNLGISLPTDEGPAYFLKSKIQSPFLTEIDHPPKV